MSSAQDGCPCDYSVPTMAELLLDEFEPFTLYGWGGTSILSPVSPVFVLILAGAAWSSFFRRSYLGKSDWLIGKEQLVLSAKGKERGIGSPE